MRRETWNDIVLDLVVNQRMRCRYCLATRPGEKPFLSTQGAHAVVHKRVFNRKKRHKDINLRLNFLPCCDYCQSFSETYKGRQHAWEVLCDWYGLEEMVGWYAGLNLKIKEIFD